MKVVMVTGGAKVTELKGKWRRALTIQAFGKASLFDPGRRPKLPTRLVPTNRHHKISKVSKNIASYICLWFCYSILGTPKIPQLLDVRIEKECTSHSLLLGLHNNTSCILDTAVRVSGSGESQDGELKQLF